MSKSSKTTSNDVSLPDEFSSMNHRQRINILHLVNGFAIGGAESKLLELVRCTDKKNYRLVVCSVGQGGPLQKEFEKLGVKVIVFRKKFSFDFSLVFKVARLIREERIDIVQTTLLYADLIGALAAKVAGVPIVISWETVSHGQNDCLRVNLRHKIAYRFAMKFVEKIVAVSDETRESIIENRGIQPSKLITIHYGVDLVRYNGANGFKKRKEIGISDGEPVVGIVARLEEVKGHRYFIQAISQLIEGFPNMKCVLIGDGTLRKSLELQVENLNLKSNFCFLGFRKDVNSWLNAIDIFVLPSLSEGLPNVILEAMACKKPVVATAVGGIPEAIIDGVTGSLVPPQDSNALAQAIGRLLKNRKLAEEMGKKSRLRVEEKFSLQHEVSEFEKLYKSCFSEQYN
ncbi:MAG: glycosyltransferase [bacterium]